MEPSARASTDVSPDGDDAQDDATAAAAAREGRNEMLITILVDLISPLVGFYVLRAFGVDQWLALLLGGIGPAIRGVYLMIKQGKVDAVATFVLAIVVVSAATSWFSGSPRLLLAKDGFVSGAIGLWMVSTAFHGKPFVYVFAKALAARVRPRQTLEPGTVATGWSKWAVARHWDSHWDTVPGFRRPWKLLTLVWGVGGVLDGVIRIVMAYTLPVDWVPALHVVQYILLYAIMQSITLLYLRRPSIAALLFTVPEPEQSAAGRS
jgi:hypothetical protein